MLADFITRGTALATAFQLGFFAIVIFQIAFIFFQMVFIRRVEYYYYILYMVCIIPYFLSHTEEVLNFPVFFSYYPDAKFYFDKPLIILNFYTYINFSRNFLDIPVKYPAFNKVLDRIIIVFVTLGCIGFAAIALSPTIYTELLFISFYIALFPTTIWCVYKFFQLQDSRLNNFILWGGILIILGSFSSMALFNLVRSGDNAAGIIPTIPAQLSILAELLVFTTGLSYKTSLIEKEKMAAERALVAELQERERIQRDVYRLRNKIASDLHDDVGATLSSISMYSEIGKSKPELVPELLNKISSASNEMVDQMSDIVWSINPAHDSFEKLSSRMHNFSLNYLSAKDIKLDYQISSEVMQLPLSMEHGKNMFLILKEAIHNAVKYSECSEVSVKVARHNSHEIRMQVSDNGKGFDVGHVKAYNGNGLNNMKARAKALNGSMEINSAPGSGTSLVVRFNYDISPL